MTPPSTDDFAIASEFREALAGAAEAGDRTNESFTVLIGNSPAMLEVFEQLRRLAAWDMPLLITGENGTGKGLVARAIHDRSRRAAASYVALNCAAVPATLIAGALFGYEKGAFAGATAGKSGHIEQADGGTLFLDEIDEMPIDLQGVLLRFLQEGQILRAGGIDPIKVDVRVVAAANARLRDAVATGKLREDLYQRLSALSLHLPPLRERDGDVEILAMYFLRQIAQELKRELSGFTPPAMTAMTDYSWPGNVRELIATLRRAAVLANGPLIDLGDLRLEAPVPPEPAAPRQGWKRSSPGRLTPGSDGEREAILKALQDSRFNMSRAAQLLGVARATLYRMLRRQRIDPTSLPDLVSQQPHDVVQAVGPGAKALPATTPEKMWGQGADTPLELPRLTGNGC